MDIVQTINKMKNRWEAVDGKKLLHEDYLRELLLHVMQLEEICLQQQNEINALKDKI